MEAKLIDQATDDLAERLSGYPPNARIDGVTILAHIVYRLAGEEREAVEFGIDNGDRLILAEDRMIRAGVLSNP